MNGNDGDNIIFLLNKLFGSRPSKFILVSREPVHVRRYPEHQLLPTGDVAALDNLRELLGIKNGFGNVKVVYTEKFDKNFEEYKEENIIFLTGPRRNCATDKIFTEYGIMEIFSESDSSLNSLYGAEPYSQKLVTVPAENSAPVEDADIIEKLNDNGVCFFMTNMRS